MEATLRCKSHTKEQSIVNHIKKRIQVEETKSIKQTLLPVTVQVLV
jgi:hypothetical protein